MLARAFYGRYGLHPAGSEALEHIDDLHDVPEIVTSSECFARRARHNFGVARDYCGLQIGGGPAACGQTVLDRRFTGLSLARRNGQLYTKAPLFEAGTITLPIGPNHSIGLGKGEDKRIDLDESDVARLNADAG